MKTKKISFNLPVLPVDIRQKVPYIVGVLLVTAGVFLLASLYSDNQQLRDQLAQAQQKSASTPAAAISNTDVQDVAAGIIPAVIAADHVEGPRDAKVFLVEYSDLECPYCKKFHSTAEQLRKDLPEVAHVYRNFPLNIHQNAKIEAQIAECVAKVAGNDAFFRFTDTIFQRTQSTGTFFNQESALDVAAELGYSRAGVASCVTSDATKALVEQQMSDGNKAGIKGTPTTFLVAADGATQKVEGSLPIETFTKALKALLTH